MAIQPDVYMTSQEYLTLEKQAEYKSEYIAGTMVAMSGASRKHNLIVTNIVTSLGQQLRGRHCEQFLLLLSRSTLRKGASYQPEMAW